MRKKLLYFYLFVGICILGYVIFKTYDFQKYSNKLEISNTKPVFKIENLFNTNNLRISYLKSVNYDKKPIAYTAIIDNKYYINVIKLGKGDNNLKINKIPTNFEENNVIAIPLIDADEQVGHYINFENYPFNVKEIKYYVNGQDIRTLNDQFSEIIFKGDYINFSFNDENEKDFGYVTPNEEMSISFVVYKNDLYAISMKSYKGYPFKSLHSLLK
ncbi:hypothetical protein ACN9MN_03585 [Chryseobacterium sp. S-02]|uniref:hypothetical protein n=1 Tax=Chryseobacterium sp. S-02 TaxID=3404064 RepID=UPI003CF516D4